MANWDTNNVNEHAKECASEMTDLSRAGEMSAQLMLEEVLGDIQDDPRTKNTEDSVNKFINAVNAEANKLSETDKKNYPYNLKFEIVDENNDGKWNTGEKVQVKNPSRYSFRQPAAFKLDGSPDTGVDEATAILQQSAMRKRAGY